MTSPAVDRSLHIPDVLAVSGRDEGVRQLLSRFQAFRSQVVLAFRSAPSLVELAASFNKDALFTIQWPAGALDALAKGDATWKRYGDGSMAVVLRGRKGKEIVKHLRVREMKVPAETASALNNLAIQAALAEIVGRLEEIDSKVERVLSGQRADRYGTIDGALNLYEQAMAAQPSASRELDVANALSSLNDGRGRLLTFIRQEADAITVPTPWEGLMKSFGETPTEKHAKRLGGLAEDAAKCIIATRAIVIIHEQRGDDRSARVAVEQLAAVARDCAPRLAQAARAVPRKDGEAPPEGTWRLLNQRILPGADVALRQLEERGAAALSFDVSGRELLTVGAVDG